MGALLRKRAMRLCLISSLTRRLRTRCSGNCELLRSSPRVCGSLLKGWIPPGSRPPSSPSGPNAAECSYSTPARIAPARDGGGAGWIIAGRKRSGKHWEQGTRRRQDDLREKGRARTWPPPARARDRLECVDVRLEPVPRPIASEAG